LVRDVSLAFEYHGGHHYRWSQFFGDPRLRRRKDQEKISVCNQHGITLIEIPFWWDERKKSLIGTIVRHRPDLCSMELGMIPEATIHSIPENAPSSILSRNEVASVQPVYQHSVNWTIP